MNDAPTSQDPLMPAIIQALEAAPSVYPPDDFAARVMAQLPQRHTHRVYLPRATELRSSVGGAFTAFALLVILGAMLMLAPRTQGSPVWLSMQVLLFVEFSALLFWFVLVYRRVR